MSTRKTLESEMAIGAKLGAIIQNSDTRERLIDNPTAVLSEIGVDTRTTIFADTADKVHLVVPAEVDEARVAAGDETYFEELGKLALGTCMYKDFPED